MRLAELDTEVRKELEQWEIKEFTALIRVMSAEEMGLGKSYSNSKVWEETIV